MSNNEQIISRVLEDAKFCQDLTADPENTLRGLGVDATPEVVAALKGLDAANLQRLATAFGKQQAAF